MTRFWQGMALVSTFILSLQAEESSHLFVWDAPKVTASLFTNHLGMLDSERDDYASHLATAASNRITTAKASPASLSDARRMIALALQLSPRNKKAVVLNFQLSKGVVPDPVEATYSSQAFARLMLTRGQLLAKQGGEENIRLARYFIQLSAEFDPKNEDAVYASEVQRLNDGEVDWSPLLGDTTRSNDSPGTASP